jgi:beta-phosphoglucomutase
MTTRVNNAKAIVFDMDGVLFDSERLHTEAWQQAMGDYDIIYIDSFFDKWIGIPDSDFANWLAEEHPKLKMSASELLSLKQSKFHKLIEQKLIPFDGVVKYLEQLSDKLTLAVASSSGKDFVNKMLNLTKLENFFKVKIGYSDVQNHKPHPEPYLTACKQLGIAPDRTIGIEDSPSGVQSSFDAGLYTIAIKSTFDAEKLSSANKIFNTTEDACCWIYENLN